MRAMDEAKARQRPVRMSDDLWGKVQMAASDAGVSANEWVARTLAAVLDGRLVPAEAPADGALLQDACGPVSTGPMPLGSPGGCGHERRRRVGLSLVCADCWAPVPALPGAVSL